MKLDPKLAQSIVDKMMENIPYNINMMNEKGYIIASGNKERINTLHIGAIETIESGKTKPMVESFGKFGQPGVNIPVEFQGKTIGVIGITGDPKKVTPLASLLKVSIELLITQINSSKAENLCKESLNHFLYQWTTTDNILENQELKSRAQALNINLELKRFAIILETKNPLSILEGDFYFNKTPQQQLIITRNADNLEKYLELSRSNRITIGISNQTTNLKKAVQQASDTIKVIHELQLTDTYYYYQINFLNKLLQSRLYSDKTISAFKNLLKTRAGSELIGTLDCYFKSNGNVTKTSNKLNIHRNTTNYRLNKLSDYFNLNLHDITDMFELYTDYLHFKKYIYEQQNNT